MQNRMKQLRQEKGISQEQIAVKLGVSRQTIISIEKGRYNPSLPLAMQIARLFGTIVEEVFLLDEEDRLNQ
ncbi:helix-turn-helix transcriptional regulator [Evansella sp. AB-rgal1]|uniref:helix-turn-helix transcriptional regulator n=1 Tax=Evansella sp. AB-rgal1 TaxID=3242696 RepID=UPI00359D015A